MWNDLTDKQKAAILDHELEHCFVEETETGDVIYKLLPHDLEEFNSIVTRHGLYAADIELMQQAMETAAKKLK